MAHNKCRCGAPHDDWPGKDGDLICQMCWESDCSESMSAENEPMTTEQMEAYVRAQWKYIGIWVRDLLNSLGAK